MDQKTIKKLEEYRDKLTALEFFEERLSDSEYDRLEVSKWSSVVKDWLVVGINLEKEPTIKEGLLKLVKDQIEYYNKKIEEL